MNIHELSALIEVVERGGLSPAASALGLTTSAISRRISRLEEELGVQLLLRTTRSTEPTEVGRRVLAHARSVIAAVQLVRDEAHEGQMSPRGLVRVVLPMGFGRLHVTPLLADVRHKYPEIELDLVFDDRRGRILEYDFDIALVARMPQSERVFVTRVAELTSVVCAAPTYIEAHGRPQDPSALEAHNNVLYSYSGSPDVWVFKQNDRTFEVQVSGSIRANNGEVVAELIRRGLGVGRVPEFIAEPFLRAGELLNLFPAYNMATVPLFLVTQQRPLPFRVRVVHDLLATGLRQSSWSG